MSQSCGILLKICFKTIVIFLVRQFASYTFHLNRPIVEVKLLICITGHKYHYNVMYFYMNICMKLGYNKQIKIRKVKQKAAKHICMCVCVFACRCKCVLAIIEHDVLKGNFVQNLSALKADEIFFFVGKINVYFISDSHSFNNIKLTLKS